MHLSIDLFAFAVLFTLALSSPLPHSIKLMIAQNNGVNYTAPVEHDTGPILQPPNNPPPDDCPQCGPDGQPPLDSCGSSSFWDRTSDASPFANDCLNIAKSVEKGGKWNVESVTGNQHQLVEWGTCAFGVQPTDHVGGYFEIGNLDIIDIINTSVDQFANFHGGKVGSAGYMECGGSLGAHGTSHGVQWGIYHT
ncbi:hypothetical protein BR93DRAFT_759529 [Coniochaeta sp. PMI_546]|nr:hypothetical protein BR93DRAFT_759529 [Coniochaeta sp. PMI_546]